MSVSPDIVDPRAASHRLGFPARSVWSTLAVGAAAVLAGAALSMGSQISALAILLASVPLLVVASERFGFRSLVVWVVCQGIATPFFRFPPHHTLVTFDRLWIPLTAAGVFMSAKAMPRTSTTRRLGVALVLLTLILGLRAATTAPDLQRYALGLWVDALVLPTLLYFTVRRAVTSRDQVRRLAGAFVLAGIILSVLAVLEKLFGFELATRTGGALFIDPAVGVRYSGPYPQSDMLSITLLICIAMTLLWAQLRGPSVHLIAICAVAIECVGLWLTFFRGAWIAALVVIVVSLGLRPRRYARLLGIASLAGVIAVIAFIQLGDNANGLAARLNNTQNVSGRVATYQQGFRIFAHHPLAGVGALNFASGVQVGEGVSTVAGVQATTTAHDSYVSVLVEEGLLGFLALLWTSFYVWRLVHDLRRSARTRTDVLLGAAVMAAVLAYLIMSLELTVIFQGPPNLFLAMCLGMGAARLDAIGARAQGDSSHSRG